MKLRKMKKLVKVRNKRINSVVLSHTKRLHRLSLFDWKGVLR